MNVGDGNVILLVEDNPDDVKLTQRAFKKSNISNQVVVARDGVEALDYLLGTGPYEGVPHPPPQVALVDIKMPRMDGLELLRRIRSDPRTEFLPVVMLTSSSEEQDLVRSYQLRANSYIRKPVDFARFVEATRTLGMYWLLFNETPAKALPAPDGGPRLHGGT